MSKVVAVLRAIPNPSEGPQEKVQDRAHKARGIKSRLLRGGKVLCLIQDRLGDAELQKSRLSVKTIRRKCESRLRVPEMQSTSHPHAQRTAFRCRDVRRQSRSFARCPLCRLWRDLQGLLERFPSRDRSLLPFSTFENGLCILTRS